MEEHGIGWRREDGGGGGWESILRGTAEGKGRIGTDRFAIDRSSSGTYLKLDRSEKLKRRSEARFALCGTATGRVVCKSKEISEDTLQRGGMLETKMRGSCTRYWPSSMLECRTVGVSLPRRTLFQMKERGLAKKRTHFQEASETKCFKCHFLVSSPR